MVTIAGRLCESSHVLGAAHEALWIARRDRLVLLALGLLPAQRLAQATERARRGVARHGLRAATGRRPDNVVLGLVNVQLRRHGRRRRSCARGRLHVPLGRRKVDLEVGLDDRDTLRVWMHFHDQDLEREAVVRDLDNVAARERRIVAQRLLEPV